MNNMKYNFYHFTFLVVLVSFMSCQDDTRNFDNKAYVDDHNTTRTVFFEKKVAEQELSLVVSIARPANRDLALTYIPDLTLVDDYNLANHINAQRLPVTNYELPKADTKILQGNVKSNALSIRFVKMNELDPDNIYVLPVTVVSNDIEVMEKARTFYYIIKEASLINVVADIEKNKCHIDTWSTPEVVRNLSQVTMEALIYVRNFNRTISTIMGVEDKFLLRIGDERFPANQLQLAVGDSKFPAADTKKGLPVNRWCHVAVTYDSEEEKAKIYVDGKLQSEGKLSAGTVSLDVDGKDGFYIGYSYEEERYLSGEISECRIWNRVLAEEEINAENHFYQVEPTSQGLVAYWKCNEGKGKIIEDKTGNGNNLEAVSQLKWVTVALPEKKYE